MTNFWFTFCILLLLAINATGFEFCKQQALVEAVQMARSGILHAIKRAQGFQTLHELYHHGLSYDGIIALDDCVKLYEESEPRLARIVSGNDYSYDDGVTWLSAALASHRSCLDGLVGNGLSFTSQEAHEHLSLLLKEALASFRQQGNRRAISNGVPRRPRSKQVGGLLASWNPAISEADIVVAQDGSGNFRTINDAVDALAKNGNNRPERAVIYVKSGVYNEQVEIRKNLKNVLFVGDGMDKTVVTGCQNVPDGASTSSSATFGVSGDGFWARDMTFENTAGPIKHQAVALRVSSDLSIFYRCSFKGYQDTLFVHSLRQFYRDCHIYGTIDFIFGDASAVFQNCDIFIRRPMSHQSNMITAQGRDDANEPTGISIIHSRVAPSPEFAPVERMFKSYLGRPWKKYSRTVFIKTDLDGLIDPKGWNEWSGDFALSTLYYGEYMNTGNGASTGNRVKWPGYHVLHDEREADKFSVRNFIQGDHWLQDTGVPYWSDI